MGLDISLKVPALVEVSETVDRGGCHLCRHADFDTGEPGYSEWTPGRDMSLSCLKGHWSIQQGDDCAKVRAALSTARHCPDFEPVEVSR